MQPNNLVNIFLLFATQLFLLFQLVNEILLRTVLNEPQNLVLWVRIVAHFTLPGLAAVVKAGLK